MPAVSTFTVTRAAGTVLPSQKKLMGDCTVATAGFDDVKLTGMPSRMENALLPGTVANSRRLKLIWRPMAPAGLNVTLAFSQAIVAPTCITMGVGEE